MAHKMKRLSLFIRLDTIMETTEREENGKDSCCDFSLPHHTAPSSNAGDSSVHSSEKRYHLGRSSPTGIAVSSTRIHNRSKDHKRRLSFFVSENQEDNLVNKNCPNQYNTRTRQVEKLFPEFFSCQATPWSTQDSELHDNKQKNAVFVCEKDRGDPFIRSWLSLYGARFSI